MAGVWVPGASTDDTGGSSDTGGPSPSQGIGSGPEHSADVQVSHAGRGPRSVTAVATTTVREALGSNALTDLSDLTHLETLGALDR